MRCNLAGAKAMLNVRAIYESDCRKTFQKQRREDESKRYHPHRGLLADYQPLALAI